MKGAGTDEEMLIDVLAHRTPAEVEAIKEAYLRLYGKTLEHDLAGGSCGRVFDHQSECIGLEHCLAGGNCGRVFSSQSEHGLERDLAGGGAGGAEPVTTIVAALASITSRC